MNLLPKHEPLVKVLFIVSMLVITIAGLKSASDLLAPILFALFIAIIAGSFIDFLKKRGLNPFVSWFVVLSLLIGFILLVSILISSSLFEFSQKLPFYVEQLDIIIKSYIVDLDLKSSGSPLSVEQFYNLDALLNYSNLIIGKLSGGLSNSFLITLMVTFMLMQKNSFIHKVEYISDKPEYFKNVKKVIKNIDHYMMILSFVSFLTGITVYIGLMFMGIDFALMWAMLAFFLNFIPNIGSFIAAAPPILLALIQFDGVTSFTVMLFYAVINIVYGNILQPKIIGKGLDLSILVVFLSMLLWGWIFGIIGMFLSVPLTVLVKIILENNEDSRWMAVMLGSDPYEKK